MIGLVEHLLGVIAPVLLCAGVGFLLARAKMPFDPKLIGSLAINVAMPALIISHLANQHVDFATFAQVVLAALLVMVLFAGFDAAVILAFRLPIPVFLGA